MPNDHILILNIQLSSFFLFSILFFHHPFHLIPLLLLFLLFPLFFLPCSLQKKRLNLADNSSGRIRGCVAFWGCPECLQEVAQSNLILYGVRLQLECVQSVFKKNSGVNSATKALQQLWWAANTLNVNKTEINLQQSDAVFTLQMCQKTSLFSPFPFKKIAFDYNHVACTDVRFKLLFTKSKTQAWTHEVSWSSWLRPNQGEEGSDTIFF